MGISDHDVIFVIVIMESRKIGIDLFIQKNWLVIVIVKEHESSGAHMSFISKWIDLQIRFRKI